MRRYSSEVARFKRTLLFSACLSLCAPTPFESLPRIFSAAASGGSRSAAKTVEGQSAERRARLSETFGRMPLRFEENRGQTSPEVKYLSRGSGYTLFLTRAGATLRLLKAAEGEGDEVGRAVAHGAAPPLSTLHFRLLGSKRSPKVTGIDEQGFKSNYLVGADATSWRTGVANFGRVKYESVYPGIVLPRRLGRRPGARRRRRLGGQRLRHGLDSLC